MWLSEMAKRARTNYPVNAINAKRLHLLPGYRRSYKYVDTVSDHEQIVCYPVVFLDILQPAGVPPHNIIGKVGAPILLLRKLAATPL